MNVAWGSSQNQPLIGAAPGSSIAFSARRWRADIRFAQLEMGDGRRRCCSGPGPPYRWLSAVPRSPLLT